MRLFLSQLKLNKFSVYRFINRFLFLAIASLLVGCGKKQKHIFVFDTSKKINVSVFDLPSVRGVVVTKEAGGVLISWLPASLDGVKPKSLSFGGYNVYRLTKAGMIPKKPLNKLFLTEPSFIDRHDEGKVPTACYLIKAVFLADKEIFYGPASRIAKLS